MDRDMQESAAMQALDRNTGHRTYAPHTSGNSAQVKQAAIATPVDRSGVLDLICERILSAGYQIREFSARLEYHTDAVRGAAPQSEGNSASGTDMPNAKLDRIQAALDQLDQSLGYLAEQTGRATTLV